MRRFALLIAFACCLIGMAAQPASAQQGQWAAARQQRRAMMRARRQAAARAYGARSASARLAREWAGGRSGASTCDLERAPIQVGRVRMKRRRLGRGRLGIRVRKAPVRRMRKRRAATAQPNARAMAGLPPKWVENLRDKPPAGARALHAE